MSTRLEDPTLVDGRYRLDVELGSGAFGSVYKATQVVLDRDLRDVALKLFHGDAIHENNVAEVMNDAIQILALLAKLSDWEIRQHFVTIYDLGVTRDARRRGYIAMELVRGGNLDRRIRDYSKFTLSATLRYMIQISRALAFMHEKGFVHSDLKPANILIFRGAHEDLIKLGDFGLAGQHAGPFAQHGPRGGTMSYMAPEALHGSATTTGCDVFSLGVLAYEMLTGQNPYADVGSRLDATAANYQQCLQHQHQRSREVPLRLREDQFPELATHDPQLRRLAPLVDVVNQMLETDLAKRYHSAVPVLRDLRRIAEGRLPEGNSGPAFSNRNAHPEMPKKAESDELERFQFALRKQDWSDASRIAGALMRTAPQDPRAYELRGQVPLAQATHIADQPGTQSIVQQLRSEALHWLNRALNYAQHPQQRRALRHAIADVYQQMGDHATAQQIRNLQS